MTSRLHALRIDARDPDALADFWAGLLGRDRVDEPGDGPTVLPREATEFRLRFVPNDEPHSAPHQIHLHLTSAAPGDQQATVDRALALGGRHLDVGQLPDEDHVVLADPEGNELCVIEAGNSFLAGCGFLGELACDGSREVGVFWSEVLAWPLVWDEDEETAVQSPAGGAKVAWGGPPVRTKTGRNRLLFDLVADDLAAEVERLVSLGATVLEQGERVLLADPDGNEFLVRA